jgi:predicted NBD/HSP70 family sugar kinase
MVTDLRGREIEHVIVPTVDHADVKSAAAWLVGLITRACQSADGPLRQIVIAVPGRVRDGREIFGPAESMEILAGDGLHRRLQDLVDAPVLLESDANSALLGIMIDDATVRNAALFNVSSILNFASCTDHELVRGHTSLFGDIGVLPSGVDNETLDVLLSTSGLLRFARGRGLDLQRIDDLWLEPQDEVARAEVMEAFTTAIVTAVRVVAVTLDPESVYFVGRLRPLVDEILPELRGRLDKRHPTAPEIKAVTHVLGLSTARGAVHECLTLARGRLRDAVLETRRRGQPAEQSMPAF